MADGYVMLTLGGVQEFIAASRRTADLWTASRLMSRLCQVAVRGVTDGNGEPVLPAVADVPDGLPNRIFAVVPAGGARRLAERVARDVHAEWDALRTVTFASVDDETRTSLDTFPVVRWVVWEQVREAVREPAGVASPAVVEPRPEPGGVAYEQGWRVLSAASQARRRVRDFKPYAGQGAQPCSLCGSREGIAGRGAARDGGAAAAPAIPGRLRLAPGERLCPVCAVKRDPNVTERLAGERAVFPSTASVATAPFRVRILRALAGGNTSGPLAQAVRRHRDAVHAVTATLRAAGAGLSGNLERPGALPALEAQARLLGDGALTGWSWLEGSWCLADTWQPESLLRENGLALPAGDPRHGAVVRACAEGRQACAELLKAFASTPGPDAAAAPDAGAEAGLRGDTGRPPASYLALIVQDADSMGRALSHARMPTGRDMRDWHGQVSKALVAIAGAQVKALEDEHGRAVYAGGDDLLGLVPAASALRVAGRCRELFRTGAQGLLTRPSVSTAVVFFHISYPLQDALGRARDALKAAKQGPGKASLALVVLRRGGERAATVLPWRGRGDRDPAASLTGLVEAFRGGLSPRLIHDMYDERHGIAELAGSGLDYGAEVSRLVTRHSAVKSRAAEFTGRVREVEPATSRLSADDMIVWVDTLEIARFVAQEGR